MIELELRGAEVTRRLGAALGAGWPRTQPRPQALYLTGELGAGKTTLAQGLIAALGVAGPIRSPSYSLLEVYPVATGTVVHADLYRLRGREELEALGWRDYCVPGVLQVVEWPQNAGASLPAPDLNITLEFTPRGRRARLEPSSEAGSAWLDASGITAASASI
jgi:tRNA threonylcarbamoyladenosine biosynthesis protein TsaE